VELTLEACEIKISDLNGDICVKDWLVKVSSRKQDVNENKEKGRLEKTKDVKLLKSVENTKGA
jgi:hypothetical protein